MRDGRDNVKKGLECDPDRRFRGAGRRDQRKPEMRAVLGGAGRRFSERDTAVQGLGGGLHMVTRSSDEASLDTTIAEYRLRRALPRNERQA